MENEILQQILSKLDKLEQGQVSMQADINCLKTDVSDLKTDVKDTKSDVKEINLNVKGLWRDVSLHDSRFEVQEELLHKIVK